MTFFLDTNAVVDAIRGTRTNVRKALNSTASTHTVAMSSIVMFELEFGVANSLNAAVHAARLAVFMTSGCGVVPFDQDDSAAAATIRANLARAGTPIGPYALLLAAQVLRRGATLVTANTKEFKRVSGLAIVSWR